MRMRGIRWVALLAALAASVPLQAQMKRRIIIDEDGAGPATTNQQAILSLIQSPETEVLGIGVPSGDQWREEEVAHTLRMLELIGRTDIPVVPGAVYPLKNRPEFIARWEKRYGKVVYQGAWNWGKVHGPEEIPPLAEGQPATKPAGGSAAEFLVRMVRRYPHQVTIFAAGPLTDLALAIQAEPHFAAMTEGLVLMGGSIDPKTDDPEFRDHPHREFNFWIDPEAAHIVLSAGWPSIVDTPVDISLKTRMTKAMIERIGQAKTPVARYIARYAQPAYMWDELAAIAWLDPAVVTRTEKLYLDVSTDRGATYGDTLALSPARHPGRAGRPATVNLDLDKERFYHDFVELMTGPTPGAHFPRSQKPAASPRY
jgi:purine nucleosidase